MICSKRSGKIVKSPLSFPFSKGENHFVPHKIYKVVLLRLPESRCSCSVRTPYTSFILSILFKVRGSMEALSLQAKRRIEPPLQTVNRTTRPVDPSVDVSLGVDQQRDASAGVFARSRRALALGTDLQHSPDLYSTRHGGKGQRKNPTECLECFSVRLYPWKKLAVALTLQCFL